VLCFNSSGFVFFFLNFVRLLGTHVASRVPRQKVTPKTFSLLFGRRRRRSVGEEEDDEKLLSRIPEQLASGHRLGDEKSQRAAAAAAVVVGEIEMRKEKKDRQGPRRSRSST
jgi:hypothetical protein